MTFQEAIALHRTGRDEEAALAYQAVLRDDPSHVPALIHLGTLRLRQGSPAEAEALFRRATQAAPDSAEACANLAAALQAMGRHDEAVAAFQRALGLRTDMTDARLGLGASLLACGRVAEAIDAYEAVLATDPGHPEANFSLAAALARSGRAKDAEARYRAALAADEDFAEAHLALGQSLALDDALDEAVEHFRAALDVDPDYLEARVALGAALSRLRRDDEAMAAFERVLAADPAQPDARKGLGTLLDRKRRHAEAIAHYRAVLATNPDDMDALAGLATALKNTGQHAEALQLARRIVAERPDYPPALSLLGLILAEIGSTEEATRQFGRAVALAPRRAEFAYYLTEMGKVAPEDHVLSVLEAMAARIGDYPPDEQCLICFALAKACDDIGERQRGFDWLLRGNAIKRAHTEYKEAATLSILDRVAKVFTPDLLAARADQGAPSRLPIFIVGMPRSGTTLVEQILASHSAVFGAGERTELPRAVARMTMERFGTTGFPEAVWTLSAEALRDMGAEYVAALRALAPGAERIVDKMPANFAFVGLIRLILPNAKIIHATRDPVDTCLSCFSKLFSGEQPFSYELGELGRYYAAYRRLMAHWRAVLPHEFLLDVVYEELVADLETQARRIVAHCGLPWDPACLAFHATPRAVHTASMVQVRQPIYRSSVGRWRPDASLLRPLLDGLADQAAVDGVSAWRGTAASGTAASGPRNG